MNSKLDKLGKKKGQIFPIRKIKILASFAYFLVWPIRISFQKTSTVLNCQIMFLFTKNSLKKLCKFIHDAGLP